MCSNGFSMHVNILSDYWPTNYKRAYSGISNMRSEFPSKAEDTYLYSNFCTHAHMDYELEDH